MPRNKRLRGKSVLPEDQPIYSASVAALLYISVATLYILVSDRIAAHLASSLEQLRVIETHKGIVFVLVTGLLFFLISLGFWRKARRQRNLLVQSERKAVAALYSAALAHDLNNLLLGLLGLVETIKARESGDEFLAQLRVSVERSIQRLAPFSKRIAATAKNLPLDNKVPTDLQAFLPQVIDMVQKHFEVRFCTVEIGAIPPVTVTLNQELLDQTLLNLIVNAAQASGPKGKIRVAVARDSHSVTIEVHDSGPGISSDITETIFEPGFTTRSTGCGLGLLTVEAFAASSHAEIEIARSPLGGALFRIVIPLSPESDVAAP